MALESRRIDCTKCGGPLELRSERSKTVACEHCHAVIDLTSADYAFIESMQAGPIRHPLRVGQVGTLKGVSGTIIGHLRYTEATWYWDEYLVVSDDGFVAYIQYDEGVFTLYVPFVPAAPKPVSETSVVLEADGRRDPVKERGTAVLSRIEGELTWRARVGDRVEFFEGRHFCVETGETEVEWFTREALPRDLVAKAFAIDSVEFANGCYVIEDDEDDEDDEVDDEDAPRKAGKGDLFAILVLFVFFVFVAMCAANDDDDLDDDYGGGHFHSSGYSGGK